MLASAGGPLRPVGAGHSFAALVPTDGHLVVLDRMRGLLSHDDNELTAEFWSGTRLSETGPALDKIGQAMFNLPDIDRQTVAGAIATSTHGTGRDLHSLSGYVTALQLVTPGGEIMKLSPEENAEVFQAARVSLGALGFVTRVSFQNRKPFRIKTRTWAQKTEEVLEEFGNLSATHEHFEMMPFCHSEYAIVIAHQETTEAIRRPESADDDGELLALIDATPISLRGMLIDTLAGGVVPEEKVTPSWEGLANLRFDRFNEMEYSVPADAGPNCLREILKVVGENDMDVTIPLEYRLIDGDDAWISMFEGGPRVSISVHRLASEDFRPLFDLVEPIFWKYDGRPHWGKVHTLGYHQLKALYPRLAEFVGIQRQLDPEGRMLNDHLRHVLGISEA
jgi:FAD-linked oxidoreductase